MNRDLDAWFPRPQTGALSGLLVADFSRVLAGPYATMLLADLGATVIKIESPDGDETRHWRPPVHDGDSTYYLSVNRNKHSIALDLRDPEDNAAARAIAARADVLIENFKPDGLVRFGLDERSVRTINQTVIYASITGFGAGAGDRLPGYDLLAQAMSGLMDLTGEAEGEPQRAGVAVVDVITGLHAATGILAALHHRDRTGEGQHLQLSLLMSALSGLVNQSGAHVLTGQVPHRMGNAHPSIAPYEPFATKDKQLVIAVGNDRQFALLAAAVGRPEWAEDQRFATNAARVAHRDQLRALLTQRLRTAPADAWHETLTAAGVPSAPILDVRGGVTLAEQLGLDPVARTGSTGLPTVRHPVAFDRTPAGHDREPPSLGADGDHIRAWLKATERR